MISDAGYTAHTVTLRPEPGSAPPGIVLAGLGAVALAGSATLTRTTARRRRKATAQV